MRKFHFHAFCLLIALILSACSGSLRPNLDKLPLQDLAYRQEEITQPGLRLVYFGTSTIHLSDGAHAILIDGFFSRPSWRQLLLKKIEPNQEEIDFALEKTGVKKVDAIIVAHSHHDHAMDSGLVAQKTKAVLHGSISTLNIARGLLTPESQLQILKAHQPLVVGRFQVTAYKTPHSPNPINPGFINCPLSAPAWLSEYRAAESFSFLIQHPLGNVLVVPSANFKLHAFDGIQASVVLLSIGSLGKQSAAFTERYWSEVVGKADAKLVLPIHWDDFTRSLKKPLVPLPRFMDNMSISMNRIQRLAKRDGVAIRFLPLMQQVNLPVQQEENHHKEPRKEAYCKTPRNQKRT
ncbi:MBL fold metallo-hydrolase [Pseudomonas sp. CrR25]|nr:MBL fold metallo-hydrolase [Pseudomonas sp. CrR25]